ncbi:MAG TPA: hypothetical protein VIL20_03455 [Sandaracinaceae bacterium]
MRAGRWIVVLIALVGGLCAFAASDLQVTKTVRYEPADPLSPELARVELLAARTLLEGLGYAPARSLRFEVGDRARVVTEEVRVGECAVVVASPSGRARVGHVEWLPRRGARSWRVEPAELRTEPYRTVVAASACPMRATDVRTGRAEVHFHVGLVGEEGAAEVLVLVGPPSPELPRGVPILEDRVVERRVSSVPALATAVLASLSLLLMGLMIESALVTRAARRDRERTLRRFTIAFPAGLRGVIEEVTEGGALDPTSARALRDRLASLAPLARSAVAQRWRADQDAIDALRARIAKELRERRAAAKQASYRACEDGLFTVTLLVRHRCELPELPGRLDAAHLSFALESSLPRDDAELIDVEAILHPRDRTEGIDATELERLFPELVPLAARTGTTCAACEAPVVRIDARCPACGEAFVPRAVDARLDAVVAGG